MYFIVLFTNEIQSNVKYISELPNRKKERHSPSFKTTLKDNDCEQFGVHFMIWTLFGDCVIFIKVDILHFIYFHVPIVEELHF